MVAFYHLLLGLLLVSDTWCLTPMGSDLTTGRKKSPPLLFTGAGLLCFISGWNHLPENGQPVEPFLLQRCFILLQPDAVPAAAGFAFAALAAAIGHSGVPASGQSIAPEAAGFAFPLLAQHALVPAAAGFAFAALAAAIGHCGVPARKQLAFFAAQVALSQFAGSQLLRSH
jgi:hypothetical protein